VKSIIFSKDQTINELKETVEVIFHILKQ